MARPQEIFNKKELEKRRLQKRQEKEQRKEERKANASGKSFEDMLAYVDENGNITSTPPDLTRKKSIKAEDVVIGSRNTGSSNPVGDARTGTVAFFNTSKGFGFIKDSQSGESIFVHMNALSSPIKENDKVQFEVERSPKGLSATKVTVIR
ncbi:MAG TPA: cold shock domain-containing protein [Cyclobacteriaceae bacterium]|nr:cold shock domain-containing protein [Cyclobacteriaceae bacterium]